MAAKAGERQRDDPRDEHRLWRDLLPRSDDRSVIFIHIGRTGGTCLARILGRIYPQAQTFSFSSADIQGSVEAFRSLPMEERRHFRLLKGHISFGIHEAVPRPSRYITLVRDPVDRLVSAYFYIRERPEHRLHDFLCSSGLSFEEFVRSGITLETDNWETRSISGLQAEFGCCGEAMLTRAKRNIVNWFAVCGSTERFDETLMLLRATLGWGSAPLYYTPENALRRRPRRADVPASWIEAAERQNPLDRELFAFARSHLERSLAKAGLRNEVERFRERNARYKPILETSMKTRALKNRVLSRARGYAH
jgi:hypothetical protein